MTNLGDKLSRYNEISKLIRCPNIKKMGDFRTEIEKKIATLSINLEWLKVIKATPNRRNSLIVSKSHIFLNLATTNQLADTFNECNLLQNIHYKID